MKVCMCAVALVTLTAVAGGNPEWEDLGVNSLNRLPPRTYSMPLANEQQALTDALEPETPYRKSLNGIWKISWAGNPDLRVRDFEGLGYDDSAWFDIDVPSCTELRGFGAPGYTNVRYPHANKWPKILDRETEQPDFNPVSTYRTRFTVPENWKGRDVILRFDGVGSAYYVWVNGQKVGYAEDSKLPSEFDITPYLQAATNVLAVEVYKWCDGSYLEDQDMFRFSGIFRDVTLWAKPKDGIWDFTVWAGADGKLEVRDVEGTWQGTLYDASFARVAEVSDAAPSAVVAAPRLWSAEKPYLYTLVLKKGEDIRMKRVGFKEQKIVGCVFTVNGKPVKFKGVNRHETSPENGRTVSLDDMLADIRLMKRYNINAVRTCHYPDHHLWYDLCDRYGIYVIAEANVEGHEPGYGEKGLGRFPEWNQTIIERNERHVVFYRNNPSVTMWSLGNETGHGDCFRHAIFAVKVKDQTRPVHWECGNQDADVDSRMYPTVEWLEERGKLGDSKGGELKREEGGVGFVDMGKHTRGKCAFLCEYAHAMGNAIGNFAEYWDAFYRHDSLCGGCIWDWVDQAVWKYTGHVDAKTGRPERFLAYGGDFDEQPNDGPFCCNGVVDPMRNVSAKLVEVGHVHRNLVVTRSEVEGGNDFAVCFELWNRFVFTQADEFLGKWTLRENGRIVRAGAFEPPALAPLSRCRFTVAGLAEALASAGAGTELLVDFEFVTKEDCLWAKQGWAVARDQVALRSPAVALPAAQAAADVAFAEDDRTVSVSFAKTKAAFCRKSGTLCELVLDGKTVLKDPAPGVVTGPRFTIERAFVDNDSWMRMGGHWRFKAEDSFYYRGLSQLRYHVRPFVREGDSLKITTEVTGSKSAAFTHEAVWTFAADGSISVKNRVTARGTFPSAIPREGLSLVLDKSLERVEYYGRGPGENYVDRLTGSFVGRWQSTVTDLYEPYVRPQDNGYRSDIRWVAFADAAGRGVAFMASEPMFVQALHHSLEDLEFARHRPHEERRRVPLAERPEVYLNLDVRQTGLGGGSCGPGPMAKYRFNPKEPVEWTLRIAPLGSSPAARN